MFERFTSNVRAIVVWAQHEAVQMHHPEVNAEHLLLGFLIVEEAGVAVPFINCGVTLESARAAVDKRFTAVALDSESSGHLPFSESAKTLLKDTLRHADDQGRSYIAGEHIADVLVVPGSKTAELLTELLDLDAIVEELDLLRKRKKTVTQLRELATSV